MSEVIKDKTASNELVVNGSKSSCENQKCSMIVSQNAEIRSFKYCETEETAEGYNIIKQGKDVYFTVGVSNMGDCGARTIVTDTMESEVNMMFKVMDISNPKLNTCDDTDDYNIYKLSFTGYFFEDDSDEYPVEKSTFSGRGLCGKKFLVGPAYPMQILIHTPNEDGDLLIDAHKIISFAFLCRVEYIECSGYANLTQEYAPCDIDTTTDTDTDEGSEKELVALMKELIAKNA
ncbi:MAG: hypothetical protein R3Y64_04525 [Peptostreptococcaceae bacterium]